MTRRSGKYEEVSVTGDRIQAFLPDPLPPQPAVDLAPLQPLLEQATLALGRLDALSTLLPDPQMFLYSYVRKEAVLSSMIEGTQSSLSDLLLFEFAEAPGVPDADVVEVSSYVRALEHGLSRLRGGFPLSNRLVREIHQELMSHQRGGDKRPGEFRKSQVWIGGINPRTARFVPPGAHRVEECMGALESFLNDTDPSLPALVRAGLAHAQFETIHPFLDGNGRVGRLLITAFLCEAKVLREPLLYLSLHFKTHRDAYYEHLDRVRTASDWEGWLEFFLEGVRTTADSAVQTAQHLSALFSKDRQRIQSERRSAGTLLRVHEALQERPISSARSVAERSGLSFPTVYKALNQLEQLDIVRELTGKQRNRAYAYETFLELLRENVDGL